MNKLDKIIDCVYFYLLFIKLLKKFIEDLLKRKYQVSNFKKDISRPNTLEQHGFTTYRFILYYS